MIKIWRDSLRSKYRKEFDAFFAEYEKKMGPTRTQEHLNCFLCEEIIKLRSELKQLKEGVKNDK